MTTGVIDTSGKLLQALLKPVANLALVLLTLVANLQTVSLRSGKVRPRVVDTGGKFAASVNKAGVNLPPPVHNAHRVVSIYANFCAKKWP